MRNNKYTLYVHKNILKLKKVLIYFYVFDEWSVVVFFFIPTITLIIYFLIAGMTVSPAQIY